MPQPTTTGGALMGYPSSVDTGQVQPWIISNYGVAGPASSHVLTANRVYMFAFELMANCTITAMRWYMAATVTGTTDAGIYDSSGNLLGHTGATTNTASVDNSANLTANLALSPGRYYMALCCSNSTDTYESVTVQDGNTPAVTPLVKSATNATSGVLPNGPVSVNTTNLCPVMAAVVSGGIA